MVQVAGYKGRVEQAGVAAPRLGTSVSPEALGSGIGDTIAKAGAAFYQDEMLRQDQVAFLESDRKLSEWENRRLYDPKDGALAKKGKDAFGLPDTVGKDYDTVTQELRSGLANERQRAAFDRSAAVRRRDIDATLSRHVFQQVREFEQGETTNYVKNSTQAAISNYHDPERVTLEIDRARAAVVGFTTRNGLAGSQTEKQMLSQVESTIHVGIVERMIANGQDRTANEYFNRAKGEGRIAGDDVTKIESKLSVAVREGEGLRGATEIWDRMGPRGDTDPANIDKMMRDAEGKFANDPGVLKAVKGALSERFNMHNAAQRERAEGNGNAVWGAISQGAGLAKVSKMPEYLALPGKDRDAIKNHLIDRADMLRRRGEGDGDDGLYYRLVTEASDPTLQKDFAKRNLIEDRPKLSKAQWTHLVGVQVAIRSGDQKGADKLLSSERLQTAIVNGALRSAGIDPSPKDKDTDGWVRAEDFRRAARDATRALELRTGKNATDEEVQRIVDGLVIEGVTQKRWFWTDEKKRVFELKPGESIAIKVTDVPRPERAKIEAALKKNNKPVTDQAIVDLYTARLSQLRGGATK